MARAPQGGQQAALEEGPAERLEDAELALLCGPRGRGGEEGQGQEEGPLDLGAALAQVESAPEGFRGDSAEATPQASSSDMPTAAAPNVPPPEPAPPQALCRPEEPLLPCEAWLAVGGVHDPGAPLVRVANDDLQEAALRGDLGLVRRLIHAGASVNAPMRPESDDEFVSLLHVLALKPEMPNGSRIIAEIINRGANLNVRSSLGSTPLSCACLAKHIGAVEVLLEARADPSPLDDYGRKAACCAVLPAQSEGPAPEALGVEVVQLLARAGADLDDGGDVRPIVQAVRQLNGAIVVALLEGGATPEGLHEAVESAPVPIILELIRAEANPFTKDAKGKSVMDIALARGDEEVTTLLRDFIGDLQRQQHQHLRTLEEQMRAEAREDVDAGQRSRNNSLTMGVRRSQQTAPTKPVLELEEQTAWSLRRERLQVFCRRVNRNKTFQVVMFTCLLMALFLPDFWVLLNITSSTVLDVLLVVILLAFMTEMAVQVVGLWRSYTGSFFFWMDLVGVLSVPLDHSLVTSALPMSFDNAVVMRAARMAKLGARAGRFSKLVKLLRFLPGFEQGSAGTAKVISGKLNMALSTRISCLIIVMVMVLPLFEFLTYPESDFSMKVWAEVLDDAAREEPEGLAEVLAGLQAFYREEAYYPFEAYCAFANGSGARVRLSRPAPALERSRVEIRAASGGSYLSFSFKSPQQIDALCNCLLIATIMVLMMGSGLVLMNSVSSIVLTPLEQLLSNVQKIASKIFSSVTVMAGRASRDEEKDEDEAAGEECGGFGNETQLLEKVLRKLSALSEITAKKSPLDAETLSGLNEGDRALLQGYSEPPARPQSLGQSSGDCSGLADLQEQLLEAIDGQLLAAGVSWEDFDSWGFNALELDEAARTAVCLGILSFHHSSACLEGPSSTEWTACCTRFIEAAARGYRSPKEVPYHNWAHAVDVTFTLFRLLNTCKTEHFFGAYERFALAVGAVCHDIGHPGLNNPFLVETSHELAIRYNDQSPLESMHCARLFELTRQPGMAIFAGLQRAQYAEVRRVCIEAVLHTDYQHHFTMVKEIQTFYEMNCELFDTSEEMYRTACIEFPSKEVVDFFRGADVKMNLRNVFLHVCDVSNPMKAFHICEAWAMMIVEEFFLQGDREKELSMPVQPLNDRAKVNRPYSQLGFIEFFVAPLAFALDRLMPTLDFCTETMLENLDHWFDRWAEETEPQPDAEEQAKVRERLAKLAARSQRPGA